MAETQKSPFSFKSINRIYGVQTNQLLLESRDELIESARQNARKNSDVIKSQIISYLKDVQPQYPPLNKNREEVQEIINDIHSKGFISWMLTKKQMRNLNKQKRLGNKEYTSDLIKRVESTNDAQLLKKQSTIFSDEIAQNLSPKSHSSNFKISQLALQRQESASLFKKTSKNVSIISTEEKPLPNKQSILLNNYKSQDSLLRENYLNFSEAQTDNNMQQSQFSNAKGQTPIKNKQQVKPLLLNLPNHARTGSLPANLNQIKQNYNLISERLQIEKSKFQKPIQKILIKNINLTDREQYKSSQDDNIKQVFSNDSTCYNSRTINQVFPNNNTVNNIQQGFLSERALNNQTTKFTNKIDISKILSTEEKAFESYIKQNNGIQNAKDFNFNKYQNVKQKKIWQVRKSFQLQSKISNELDQMQKQQENQKIKVQKQLKNANELYNLEEYPVITQQMQQKNREIMHSPFFEVNVQEPYRKTFLLYDYLEDESKFKQREFYQDTQIPKIQKSEAFKKFNHFIQKYKIMSQI
ncbi:hypothetical protein TTHERM_00509010 (macronuclear) [Tetrahymena thermophila SB210]|uniref:Uncharacterized protein n=1 Tax=Tetrahymena thermophila (strain SB210) TaxID=312017 RepID=I7MIU1_TETTS|nr:hypothetical protein TTHERM_00509010 [Tetrahymena thermophila SB210]EAR94960.2 hypothetical protein TTHERM_00509010 [Tetrahymena thermophila SB210]|eukprot:XP_001015205.2 hypothetical protein TTHERM_00509010 [Tetrahymena thermophila SB210]